MLKNGFSAFLRFALTAVALSGAAVATAQIPQLQLVQGGYSQPLAIRNDGSNRIFVVEKTGGIKIIAQASNFMTVSSSISCQWNGTTVSPGFTASGSEQGLLGLTFHPQYLTNRRFFVHFSDSSGDTVIAEMAANSNLTSADPNSCKILLRVDQDFSNHNGGNVLFGPDGLLYAGMGDGGSGGDPCGRGQTLNPAQLVNANPAACAVDSAFTTAGGNSNSRALLGKMLRLDVDTPTAAGHSLCGVPSNQAALYSIPASNSFNPVACPEVMAFGLRNPWRFSFDRSTGDFIIGDVGQNAFEEVNIHKRAANGALVAGLNYGWNCWEGETAFNGCTSIALSATHDPVMVYANPGSASVTGGYIYRGPVTALTGLYFAADAVRDRIFVATPANITAPGLAQPNWSFVEYTSAQMGQSSPASNIASFGEDNVGNLYVASIGTGNIYVLGSDSIHRNGFE